MNKLPREQLSGWSRQLAVKAKWCACILQENQPQCYRGCPCCDPSYWHTFFPPLALIEKEILGTLLRPPQPPQPQREENLSAANWISIFNQLARKATKQLCAYARSHWSMLCLASCFTVETLSGLSAPLTENRTENQKLGTQRAHTHGNKMARTCKCGHHWRKQFVSPPWARTPNG